MEIAVQVVFIGYCLLAGATSFAAVGNTITAQDRNRAAGFGVFLYGLFTIAFVLWWDAANATETAVKVAVIALLWLGVLNTALRTPGKTYGLGSAAVNAATCMVCIMAVLIYWN